MQHSQGKKEGTESWITFSVTVQIDPVSGHLTRPGGSMQERDEERAESHLLEGGTSYDMWSAEKMRHEAVKEKTDCQAIEEENVV